MQLIIGQLGYVCVYWHIIDLQEKLIQSFALSLILLAMVFSVFLYLLRNQTIGYNKSCDAPIYSTGHQDSL